MLFMQQEGTKKDFVRSVNYKVHVEYQTSFDLNKVDDAELGTMKTYMPTKTQA